MPSLLTFKFDDSMTGSPARLPGNQSDKATPLMTYCAFFNPDMPERIVSATRSTVTLIAAWHEHDDDDDDDVVDDGEGILTISRETYFDVMTEWLDAKTDHYRTGNIGGEGSILFTNMRNGPEGARVPAHLIDLPPANVKYGTAEYAAFANRLIPVAEFTSTRRTEHFVDMDAYVEVTAPARKPAAETDEPASVSFFRPSAAAEPEPVAS